MESLWLLTVKETAKLSGPRESWWGGGVLHGAVKVSEGEFSQMEEANAGSSADGFTGWKSEFLNEWYRLWASEIWIYTCDLIQNLPASEAWMATHLYNTIPPQLLSGVKFCNGNSIYFGTDPHSNSALSPGWLLNRKKLLMWASDSSSEKWNNSNYPTDYIKHLTKCLTQSGAQ